MCSRSSPDDFVSITLLADDAWAFGDLFQAVGPRVSQVALAVCAECEAALLQLHDFEELITYLKVGTAAITCPSFHQPSASAYCAVDCLAPVLDLVLVQHHTLPTPCISDHRLSTQSHRIF